MYFVLGTVSIQSIVTIYRSCLGRPILGPCRAFVVAEVLFFFAWPKRKRLAVLRLLTRSLTVLSFLFHTPQNHGKYYEI